MESSASLCAAGLVNSACCISDFNKAINPSNDLILFGVQLRRIGRSASVGTGVQLPSDWVFSLDRNWCSECVGARKQGEQQAYDVREGDWQECGAARAGLFILAKNADALRQRGAIGSDVASDAKGLQEELIQWNGRNFQTCARKR